MDHIELPDYRLTQAARRAKSALNKIEKGNLTLFHISQLHLLSRDVWRLIGAKYPEEDN